MFIQALQDGRILHSGAGRLASKDRFERYIFSDPSASLSPEVSVCHLGGESLPGSFFLLDYNVPESFSNP